jgi:tetratricopeptide (TPR) repeat protein
LRFLPIRSQLIRWFRNGECGVFPLRFLIVLWSTLIVAATLMAPPIARGAAVTSLAASSKRFAQTRELLARGALGDALAAVKRCLETEPHSVEGLNLLGIIQARQGRNREALDAFESALRADPRSPETHNNLGDLYVSEHRLDLAEKEFRATLRLDPADRTANYNLGAILLSQHAPGAAKSYFLHVNPPDAATRFDLVEAYLDTKDVNKALTLARSLSRNAPNDVQLHFSLGILLAHTKHYLPAVHEFELADAAEPGKFPILYNLGKAYFEMADYAKADRALHRALNIRPDSVEALYVEARAEEREGETLQAFQLLFHARKLAPRNTDVIFLLARLSMKESYYEDAIPLLEEGVKIDPRRPDLRAALGECYFGAGQIDKSGEQFRTLLQVDPSATSELFMGLFYRNQGQFAEAVKYFQDGVRKDPSSADCLYNLGYIADKQGNYPLAESYLARALRISPNDGDALFELASVRIERSDVAGAVPLLRRCAQLFPDQARVYYKLAMAERSLHESRAAGADLRIFETLAKNPAPASMPFQHFLQNVNEKTSLPSRQRAQLDLSELLAETKAHPDRPRNLYLLAQTYLKLGDTQLALDTLSRLTAVSGGDGRTMTGVGVLLARFGLYPQAIQYFTRALAALPGSDIAKYDLADAYFEEGQFQRALDWLGRISPQGRDDPSVLALLGDADARLGHLAGAESSLKNAMRFSPDSDHLYLALALVEIEAGHPQDARQTLAEGQIRIPDSGRIYWGQGVLAVAEGDDRQALNDFRKALDLTPQWESSYALLGMLYFDTGQLDRARQTLDRYSRIFPHGHLDVNAISRALEAATQGQAPAPRPLSDQAKSQFLAMAVALSDVRPVATSQ